MGKVASRKKSGVRCIYLGKYLEKSTKTSSNMAANLWLETKPKTEACMNAREKEQTTNTVVKFH